MAPRVAASYMTLLIEAWELFPHPNNETANEMGVVESKVSIIKVHSKPFPFLGTANRGVDELRNSQVIPITIRKILATPATELV